MSLIIDHKYISLVSAHLPKFKQKDTHTWNFRCPICGDSKKNTHKARGYFFRKGSNVVFMCHNCHISMSLGNFLKKVDPSLFKEYQLERYKEESGGNVSKPDFSFFKQKPVFAAQPALDLPKINQLDPSHSAHKYIVKRKIPQEKWSGIYYADDFARFCDHQFPGHGKKLHKEDPRIILPFYDLDGNLLGVQGRALLETSIRYITIKSDENAQKIFGLNTVDLKKPIYVVEGPIDSMFLPNALATMDGALYSIISNLGLYDYVFVFDNQPRNRDVVKVMQKTLEMNQKVVIWPKDLQEKDINDMVLAGYDVLSIIQQNTFSDLKAMLNFNLWRKT